MTSQFLFFFNLSLPSGLYVITCSSTNKRYIGESGNVVLRLASHKSRLRKKIHPNKILQNDYDLYKEKNFRFERILLGAGSDKKDRLVFEKLCLSVWNEAFLYNSTRSKRINGFLGKTHSFNSKKKISLARKNKVKSGLYEIINLITNQRYIGQSNYVNRRLNEHKKDLKRSLHSNIFLQKDFDFYGEESFLFKKLLIGLGATKNDRLVFEKRLILEYPAQDLYNFSRTYFLGCKQTQLVKQKISQENQGKSNKARQKPLLIESVYFNSISEASKKTGIARRLIRERCQSHESKFMNYQWLEQEKK